MGRAYLFNKDSCVWPQRQSKTKPALAFRDFQKKIDCNRWWRRDWAQSQGLWEALTHFFWIPGWKQGSERYHDSFHLCPKCYTTLRFEKTTLLARGWIEEMPPTTKKLNLTKLLLLPTWNLMRNLIKLWKAHKTYSICTENIDCPATCLLTTTYYQHEDTKL